MIYHLLGRKPNFEKNPLLICIQTVKLFSKLRSQNFKIPSPQLVWFEKQICGF